jgi:hypothetical protein
MPDNLSPETADKIRTLCRKISVAHNIDEEIQEELYSHMEDKFLGYLSGEEKITEDDAFILVKEHFGDPAVIRELLDEVHEVESDISLLRKLGAIAGASMAVWVIVQALWLSLRYLLPNSPGWIVHVRIVQYLLAWEKQLFPVLLLWIVLIIWRKMMANRRQLWFTTYTPDRFIALLAGLALLIVFLYSSLNGKPSEWERPVEWINSLGYTGIFPFLLQCILWLWWIDTGTRRNRTLLIGMFAWTGYIFLTLLVFNELGTGKLSVITKPLLSFVNLLEIFLYAAVSAGLYLIFGKMNKIRDRFVEVISR